VSRAVVWFRRDLRLSNELPSDWQEIIEDGQFFDHMGTAGRPFDPSQPLDSPHNHSLIEPDRHTGVRDIDFDLMEIVNPGGSQHHQRVQALYKDWMSLLKQGIRISGTANSDSHHANEQVAVPRNMVALGNDSIQDFDQPAFLDAIRSGHFYGTTGPMFTASLAGKQMGEMVSGNAATLKINVLSADWIPVEQLLVRVNGEIVAEQKLNGQLELSIDLIFQKDSFVTFELIGPASQAYADVYKDITPYAFSNPFFVDFDADNNWQPPGL
jgi:hypothetical protein